MKLSESQIASIRMASKHGKDADVQQAIWDALEEVSKGRKWQEEIEQWIVITNGYFHITTAYKELQAITPKEINAVRVAFHRLHDKNIAERHPTKDGWYRKRETTLVDMDWKGADLEPLSLYLPLDLDKMVNLYGGDIIVIAGESNAGKSALCLDVVEKNMNDWGCHYFSSELGRAKIKKRISFFNTPIEKWTMSAHPRHEKFHDVLFKDHSINIVDFLIATDEFWKVATDIKEMHFALRETDSIVIICIQKDPEKEYGRGGSLTEELSSLYVTLHKGGKAKIVKLKDWKDEINPNGKVCDFRLVSGAKWIQDTPWHYPSDEDDVRESKKYSWGK